MKSLYPDLSISMNCNSAILETISIDIIKDLKQFVPDMWCTETERCFCMFSFDSGDGKQTCPRPPERSGRS